MKNSRSYCAEATLFCDIKPAAHLTNEERAEQTVLRDIARQSAEL